ncbi:hypothetical protein GQ53DRAFT_765869 [Thozetella sp. PMI_491]|nr:hypothetical protein GQ53DRAFT_765869 [Thozetella sp. PMI_491]
MPRVKPEDRRRAFHPKTRTGCQTCRTSRSPGPPTIADPASGYSLSVLPGDNDLERSTLATFRAGVHDHVMVHPISFWRDLLMPLAYEDPTVRRALVALSLLQDDYHSKEDITTSLNPTAVGLYNLAIRDHLESFDVRVHANPAAALAPSVIFVVIELLRGNYEAAMSIFNVAMPILWSNLIAESESSGAAEGELSIETATSPLSIIAFAFRLTQIEADHVTQFSLPVLPAPPPPAVIGAAMPAAFHSVGEAREYMDMIGHSWAAAHPGARHRRRPGGGRQPQPNFHHVLRLWREAFDNMLRGLPTEDPATADDHEDVRVLEVRWLYMYIALPSDSLCGEGIVDEPAWGPFLDFRRTVSFGWPDESEYAVPAVGTSSSGNAARYGSQDYERSTPVYPAELSVVVEHRVSMEVDEGTPSAKDVLFRVRICYSKSASLGDATRFCLVYSRTREGLVLDVEILR